MAIAKTYKQKRFNFISNEDIFDEIDDYEEEYNDINDDNYIHHIEYMIDECCVGDDKDNSYSYQLDFEAIDRELEINKIKDRIIKEESN